MNVAVIGAGPAGIEAAAVLASQHHVTIFEKEEQPLTNIRDKAYLFPDFSPAGELADKLGAKLHNDNITLRTSTPVESIIVSDNGCNIVTSSGETLNFDYALLATGYKVFDAKKKEELGYGIYRGIVTSIEMEAMIKEGRIVNNMNEIPKAIVFLQCVGSRDEKSGNNYCSKICCVTAVKQAIEIKKISPETEISIYYMDLRMWGEGFEEMYREAQEKYGVNFVRGRISEAAGTYDNRIQIKAEDTLMGTPLTMNCDLMVLMVGMCASDGTAKLSESLNINGLYNFAESISPHLEDNATKHPRLFVAGACKRPLCINDAIQDARGAAVVMMSKM